MKSVTPSEDTRYKIYRVGAHVAWWTAFTWTAVITYISLNQDSMTPPSSFQRVSGLGIILLMGVAIALGSTLSRMRLSATILAVFEAGQRVAALRAHEAEERSDAKGMELDEVRIRKVLKEEGRVTNGDPI